MGFDSDSDEDEPEVTKMKKKNFDGESSESGFFAHRMQDCLTIEENLTDENGNYGKTWNDVPYEEKVMAWKRAYEDYDGHDAWRRGNERTRAQLKACGIAPLPERCVEKAKYYERFVDGILKRVLAGRVRITPKGFAQRDRTGAKIRKVKRQAPTAHRMSQRMVDAVGLAHGMIMILLDVKEAFFTSKLIKDDKDRTTEPGTLWCKVHRGPEVYENDEKFVLTSENREAYESYWNGKGDAYRELTKETPGTQGAPAAFQRLLLELLKEFGAIQSRHDPCVVSFAKPGFEDMARGHRGNPKRVQWLKSTGTVHVDDIKMWADNEKFAEDLVEFLKSRGVECTCTVMKPNDTRPHCGENITIGPNYEYVTYDQLGYTRSEMREIVLEPGRAAHGDQKCTAREVTAFRGSHGQTSWVTGKTACVEAYEDSYAASAVADLRIRDILRQNKLVRTLKIEKFFVKMPKLSWPLKLQLIGDAGQGEPGREDWCRAIGGKYIGVMSDSPRGTAGPMGTILCKTGRLTRQTNGSFAAETVNISELTDFGQLSAGMLEEYVNGIRPTFADRIDRLREGLEDIERDPITIDISTDCEDLIERLESVNLWAGKQKSLVNQVAEMRDLIRMKKLRLPLYCDGQNIEMDAVNRKEDKKSRNTKSRLRRMLEDGFYEPSVKAPKHRKQ